MKIFIHLSHCIYPQGGFEDLNKETIRLSHNNRLTALEPSYDGIPKGVLRRMGKAVRIGVGAALPLLSAKQLDGIILGTANGGMEDCVRFFNQIMDYDEGNLTPTNFVQSTTNAIASQIGLMAGNKQYNSTHVHAGLAFENALIDSYLQQRNKPGSFHLVGGVDEISDYNYNIDLLGGWNKTDPIINTALFNANTAGSLAGEGAAMFITSNLAEGAESCIVALSTISTSVIKEVEDWQNQFISDYCTEYLPDLIISGENGDARELPYYDLLEGHLKEVAIARYKHLSGEFPTANAIALWLANQVLKMQKVPLVMVKKGESLHYNTVLIYNVYHQSQHSLILLKTPK
jgi:hypothetical protein